MSKIKLCYYLERWASGGIECFITNMLTGYPLDGFEVDILADVVEDSIYTEAVERAGARLIQLSGKLRARAGEAAFRKLVTTRNYDILHLHIFHGVSLKYAKIAEECGIPVRIAHAHGAGLRASLTRPLKLWLHSLCCKRYMKHITLGLACSAEAARFMRLPSPMIVKNGIDAENYGFNPDSRARIRSELAIGEGPLLGHIGRLSSEKNHLFLLDAFLAIKSKLPEAILLIVGEGDMRPAIERRIGELGLADSVIMSGARTDVPELLSAMDLFLFPSLVEGFGIAAVEAQASGLPIITSTAVPSAVRISENAISLPTDSTAPWAENAARLLDIKYDRNKGAELVKEAGYDRAGIARELTELYRSLMEEG